MDEVAQGIHELDFEASPSFGGEPTLELVGSADGRVAPALLVLVTALHDRLCIDHVDRITVDMHRLEFMNASAFNALVTWLGLVNDLDPEARYKLRFRTNPAVHWQRRSLRTLSCFATDLVEVE